MSHIELRAVSKTFPSRPPVHAVREVDLEVADGELTVIVGPSGCGKTTLLRLIAGFERPDGGELWIGDELVASERTSVPPERRRVGVVPQHGALFPHLDASANVRFALTNRRTAAARARADEMLELVGLSGLGRRKPHELSGGQQQRVALARALAPRPRVVLLDEPFTALDVTLRARLQVDVRAALHESGATAVMVTHDPAEAVAMGDRLAIMREGRFDQEGTGSELYFEPLNESVARALGSVEVLPVTSWSAAAVHTPFGPIATRTDPTGATVALVRPEQLVLDPSAPTRATVRAIHFSGADTTLTLDPLAPGCGHTVRARCRSGDAPAAGDVVGVRVTGAALALRA